MLVLLTTGSGFLAYLLTMEAEAPKYSGNNNVERLQECLNKAIQEERYEDAVTYRDKLKELQ